MKRNTKYLVIILVVLNLISCINNKQVDYQLISYLDIDVDSLGHLPTNPYILKFQKDNKNLLVIGTEHSTDTTDQMFKKIEELFYNFNPEVIINEGGNLTKTYTDRNSAIIKSGELGLEKFLADKAGIKTYNGDEPFEIEFEELSKSYSREEAILFFGSERFVFPFAFGQYEGDIDTNYAKKFIEKDYKNINLTETEKTFDYYKQIYKKHFKAEFSLDTINQLDFAPFGKKHHFCNVTRKSKELRDRYLLRQIEEKLKINNKVMVVFGGWHILAIEPALRQIMK